MANINKIDLPDSKIELNPTDPNKIRKFLNMYFDYIDNHMSTKDLSEKYNYNPDYVSRILKWAVKYTTTGLSNGEYKDVMIERINGIIRKLDSLIDKTKGTQRLMPLLREKRLNEMFLSKLMDIHSDIEGKDKKLQINVQINQLDKDTSTIDNVKVKET